jgi:MFS family permease
VRSFLFWAIVAGIFIGEMGAMLMPMQIGAFMDGLQIGEASAGMLGTVETAAVALVMLAVAFGWIAGSPLKLALGGACIVAIGQVATAFVDIVSLLMVCRVLVGIGCALCQSAAVMTIASKFSDPDAVTGKVYAYVLMFLALLIWVLPELLSYGHHRVLFPLLAVIAVLALPLLRHLPAGGEDLSDNRKFEIELPARYTVLFFLGEISLLLGLGAVWAFVERMGIALGVSAHDVGTILAATMLVSMAGSFAAGLLGARVGRLLPLALGSVVGGVACASVAMANGLWSYATALLFFQFMMSFVLPYLIGTAAVIDRSGRLATGAFAVQIFSYALGTGVGGFMAETFGLSSLAWLALGGAIMAGIVFVPLCLRLDSRSKGGGLETIAENLT